MPRVLIFLLFHLEKILKKKLSLKKERKKGEVVHGPVHKHQKFLLIYCMCLYIQYNIYNNFQCPWQAPGAKSRDYVQYARTVWGYPEYKKIFHKN